MGQVITTKKRLRNSSSWSARPDVPAVMDCWQSETLVQKKGPVYFVGRMQSRVPGKSRPVAREVQIGVWGNKPAQFTLAAAHRKWAEIKQWSLDQDKDPGDFWKQRQNSTNSLTITA